MTNRWAEWKHKLSSLSRRAGFTDGLDDEIRFHLETRADELEAQGLTRANAVAQAYREFGSPQKMREDSRAAWQFRWIEDLFGDLRYALRALRRNPGFAATAVVSLALGIGANTTIFSLTTEFLFSQPSARDPQSLVAMRLGGNSDAPLRVFRFVRDSHAFTGVAGERDEAEVNWRDGERSSRLQITRVTDNFFDVIGVTLAFGRGIQPGEKRVVVVSNTFWRDHLSGDPGVLGRKLILDGAVYTIAGVLPRNNRSLVGLGFAPDLYLPVQGEDSIVALYARLPDGVSRRAAMARLATVASNVDRAGKPGDPKWNSNLQISAVSGLEYLDMMGVMPVAAFFVVLMIVVALVLLVACANVASLLLARASSRSQELAIRLSIGASRSRIVRHLLAESLLLGLLGTAGGLLLNLWLTNVFNHVDWPVPMPIQLHIQPDARLLAYAATLAIVSALVSGLLPSLKASRADVNSVLKQSEHQVSGKRWGLRNILVAGQLAVSILLLTTGLLFLRNLMKSTTMNPGFDLEQTAYTRMRLVPEKYTSRERSDQLLRSALAALRAIPGVETASIASIVPLSGERDSFGLPVKTDLSKEPTHQEYGTIAVGPQYFQTMGIPLRSGHEFRENDVTGQPAVVILNEAFARRLFGKVNPVGHWIQPRDAQPLMVVGVAKNSKYFMLGEEETSVMFSPVAQQDGLLTDLKFLIRAHGYPGSLDKPVNAALLRLDSSAAVEFKPMRDALGFALLPSRVGAMLLGSLGFLGLTLAAVGLYGVLVYSISRRTREIGLRVAFGASARDVLLLVLRESALLAGIGTLVGVGIALLATQPLKAFLVPDLSALDPLSYALVLAVLAIVVFAATLAPAVRALRVDPLIAIRYE